MSGLGRFTVRTGHQTSNCGHLGLAWLLVLRWQGILGGLQGRQTLRLVLAWFKWGKRFERKIAGARAYDCILAFPDRPCTGQRHNSEGRSTSI